MDREAWHAVIYWVAKSRRLLSDFTFTFFSALRIRWPKCWIFSISPSNEYSGLISFRINWFDLLAVQGAVKNFLQHHRLKASILGCLAFFTDQLSYSYMTTRKTILLTIQTSVDIKEMSLLFNTLSRFVIAFLPRSMHIFNFIVFMCFPVENTLFNIYR